MNNAVISGRLTATPELKKTSTGKSVMNFCVAVRRTKENTDFIECVAWETSAAFVKQHFKKGDWIEVTGSIQTRTYEQNGAKRKAVEILVNSVGFGGGKSEPQAASIPVEDYTEIEEGELPF